MELSGLTISRLYSRSSQSTLGERSLLWKENMLKSEEQLLKQGMKEHTDKSSAIKWNKKKQFIKKLHKNVWITILLKSKTSLLVNRFTWEIQHSNEQWWKCNSDSKMTIRIGKLQSQERNQRKFSNSWKSLSSKQWINLQSIKLIHQIKLRLRTLLSWC